MNDLHMKFKLDSYFDLTWHLAHAEVWESLQNVKIKIQKVFPNFKIREF